MKVGLTKAIKNPIEGRVIQKHLVIRHIIRARKLVTDGTKYDRHSGENNAVCRKVQVVQMKFGKFYDKAERSKR